MQRKLSRKVMSKSIGQHVKNWFSFNKKSIDFSFGKVKGSFFEFLSGGRIVLSIKFNSFSSLSSAYALCAPLSTVIDRQSKAFTNGIPLLESINEKPVPKNSVTENINRLLVRPNPMQTWNQFARQAYSFRRIYGYAIIYANNPAAFGNQDASTLLILPNEFVQIDFFDRKISATDRNEIIRKITFAGSDIPVSQVVLWQEGHDNVNSGGLSNKGLLSESKVVSLGDPVNNIIAAYESRGVLVSSRGAIGMLTNDETDDKLGKVNIDPQEKKDLQDDWKKYGLTKYQYQILITNMKLKWQSMVQSTKDLMLFEEIEDDVRQICDTMEYPMYLLGFKSGTTFNNVKEAKQWLYQDVLIPDGEDFSQLLTELFDLAKLSLKIKLSFDHVEALQLSVKEKNDAARSLVQALQVEFENDVITLNQWRIARGWEPVDGGDKYRSEIPNFIGTTRPTINVNANENA